ncbi:hypothetical protein AB0M95_31460 [Sphaerisporangium sp. NPDC051017]|uniref:hypothetical protein n=1 Tax=Sphaerisporangium sp. NPDC051017 TaxID=3154636 RepID=UPI003446BBBF
MADRPTARERQQIIDAFVSEAFAGVDPGAPGARIAEGMRQLPADAPDELDAAKAQAWDELATLVADPAFRQRVRQMAVNGAQAGQEQPFDSQPVLEHAGAAVAAGIAPGSPEGREVLGRIVPEDTPAEERRRLADQVETFTDRRVERFWELTGVLNDRQPFPTGVPAFEWLIEALRTQA